MLVLEGRAFHMGSPEPLALGIDGGRIVRTAKILEGDERRDYGDRLLLPAGIDLHVHFRDPGMTDKEDFGTGTASAAVGGVATVLDMPNTKPPVTSPAAFAEKLAAVRTRAHVDFGLYGALRSAEGTREFAGIAPAGKLYMAATTGELQVTDDAAVRGIVAAAAETQLFLSVHAEAPWAFMKAAMGTLAGYDHRRPAAAEAEAIRALADAAPAGAVPQRIHIAHLSSKAGLDALASTPFTAEVTPHHLLLDHGMPLDARGKVNPPLRTADDRRALWSALADGRIAAVASDHAPHLAEEKQVPFEAAPAGIPGVETMLPLLLRAVRRGDLSLERFVDVTAKRPAELLGLNAGALEVGRLANLIIVDPRDVRPVRGRALHGKCGWTPFEGMEAVFPQATYLRGELVADSRELVAERLGRPIPLSKPSYTAGESRAR